MAFLETQVEVPGKFIKESHFLNHNQAKQLCLAASNKQKCKVSSLLLKRAAELSDQLLGPVETAAFNCDHYEEYMKLLLDIAEKCLKTDDKTLIEDIKNYLKPFSRNQTSGEITGYGKIVKDPQSEVEKWNETYLELSHSSGDEEFGKNLKEIVEPKRGGKCFFFPEKYDFPCHGQSAAGTSSNPINDGRDRVISLLRA
jgi:PAS domain-containing protein